MGLESHLNTSVPTHRIHETVPPSFSFFSWVTRRVHVYSYRCISDVSRDVPGSGVLDFDSIGKMNYDLASFI
jgi:hypothetical protein